MTVGSSRPVNFFNLDTSSAISINGFNITYKICFMFDLVCEVNPRSGVQTISRDNVYVTRGDILGLIRGCSHPWPKKTMPPPPNLKKNFSRFLTYFMYCVAICLLFINFKLLFISVIKILLLKLKNG